MEQDNVLLAQGDEALEDMLRRESGRHEPNVASQTYFKSYLKKPGKTTPKGSLTFG